SCASHPAQVAGGRSHRRDPYRPRRRLSARRTPAMKLPGVRSLQLRLALSLAAVYLAATAIAVVVLLYQAYSTADALSKEDLNRRARHLASLATADRSGAPRVELPDR